MARHMTFIQASQSFMSFGQMFGRNEAARNRLWLAVEEETQHAVCVWGMCMLVIGGSQIRVSEDEACEAREGSLSVQLEELHAQSFGWALTCCAWDREEAADVLQVAYLKVLEGRAVFGGRSLFSTWFFGVIRVTASERRSKRLRRRILFFDNRDFLAPSPSPPIEREVRSETKRLRAALDQLSRRQREVIHLVFYAELSIREASEIMKVGLGTARVHYERGKKKLREQLRKEA